MRALVLSFLFVACSSQAPAPDAGKTADVPTPDATVAPQPRADIPPKACEPLAAADDAKLVRLEELALDCNDALTAAGIDPTALERAATKGQAEATEVEQARTACTSFFIAIEGDALTIAGCRESTPKGMRANPLGSALLVVTAQAWASIEAHRYDAAAKLLGRAIRTCVMVGRSDDAADYLVMSRIGSLIERLDPLSPKVLPATRREVRADLAAAVAHLLDPDERSRLLLTQSVRHAKANPDDPSAPFAGTAAAEVLAELAPDADWAALAEQATKALQAAPRPSSEGHIDKLTPAQRDYLALQSKVATLSFLDNVERNLGPLEAMLRKTQAAW